jgi:hypothetical protein
MAITDGYGTWIRGVNGVSMYQDVGDMEAWDVQSWYVVDNVATKGVVATYHIRCGTIRV